MQRLADLELIRTFVTVAETLSFSRTARVLARDATAISRRVSQLEAALGVRLIERGTRSLALTEAGAVYLAQVDKPLRALDAAGDDVAELANGEPRGTLRVSMPTTFGRLWVNDAIRTFLDAHPHISVELSYSNHVVDLIGERFDAAVRLGVLQDSRLIARRIGLRRRVVCAAPSYLARRGQPVSIDDLAAHECLRFTAGSEAHAWHFLGTAGQRRSVSISGRLASDDADVLVSAAVAGQGILNATEWLVARELAAGTLVRIVLDAPLADQGGIYVLHPSRAGIPSKTRAFVDWLARAFADQPWGLPVAAGEG